MLFRSKLDNRSAVKIRKVSDNLDAYPGFMTMTRKRHCVGPAIEARIAEFKVCKSIKGSNRMCAAAAREKPD